MNDDFGRQLQNWREAGIILRKGLNRLEFFDVDFASEESNFVFIMFLFINWKMQGWKDVTL